jgi:hypothetical protein
MRTVTQGRGRRGPPPYQPARPMIALRASCRKHIGLAPIEADNADRKAGARDAPSRRDGQRAVADNAGHAARRRGRLSVRASGVSGHFPTNFPRHLLAWRYTLLFYVIRFLPPDSLSLSYPLTPLTR